jgi:peptidoglycan/xylan/chitin deacetylase (PgdA/CDA1 family)
MSSELGGDMVFDTLASAIVQKRELLRKIMEAKSENAVHGYQHIKNSLVSPEIQENEIRKTTLVYHKLGICKVCRNA